MKKFHLDVNTFLDQLLQELGEPNNDYLRSLLEQDLSDRIVQMISFNVEPADLYYLDMNFPLETDANFLYGQVIGQNPKIQVELLRLFDEFKKEILENAHVTA